MITNVIENKYTRGLCFGINTKDYDSLLKLNLRQKEAKGFFSNTTIDTKVQGIK